MTAISDYHVHAFFPADHAVAAPDGKLYVNGGGWSVLGFPSFPQTLPPISLVAILEIPPQHFQRDHVLLFGMHDADGRVMDPRVEGQFRVGANPVSMPGDSTFMPIAVPLINVAIPRADEYAFTFSIDSRELARYQFRAVVANVAPPFLPGPGPAEPPEG